MTTAPATMTSAEREVIDSIDMDALIECLSDLIAIDSSGGRESPAQEYVAERMREFGMDVDIWQIDLGALGEDPAFSAEYQRDRALGLVGGTNGFVSNGREAGGERTLVLNGHVDVVPAGEPDRWSVPPWRGTVRDGRVYGRGSADMKGGLCCALFAVRALRNAGVSLAGRVLIQSVVGEEDGGLGTLAAIRRGHTGDAAIVLEPTELVVAPAQAGAFNFRVMVPGLAVHGALRGEGVDPIEKFLPLYAALQDLERRRNARPRHPLYADQDLPYALCVGKLRAGIWASTVAETLVFEGRYGIAVDEDPEAARAELGDALATAAARDPWLREHPPILEWWGGQFAPAATAVDHPIVTTLSTAHQAAAGEAAVVRGMPYGADMRLLVNEGATPAVLYGPGNVRRAHAPDEYVDIEDLAVVTRALVLTILRYCG